MESNKIKTSENNLELVIPEWHKKIVRVRVKIAKKSSFKPWSKVKKQLRVKSNFK